MLHSVILSDIYATIIFGHMILPVFAFYSVIGQFYSLKAQSGVHNFQVGEVLSSITLSSSEIFQPNLVNLYYLRHFLKLC